MAVVRCDIFYDYRCPFVYNAALWLNRVKEVWGNDLQVTWRYFSLEYANNPDGVEFITASEQDHQQPRGIWALRAGAAARRQGEEAFHRFHLNLLLARHEEQRNLEDTQVLVDVASVSGLDTQKFQQDICDRSTLRRIAEDHTSGIEQYGIFGTPTFVFENGATAFLKMLRPPQGEEVAVFRHLITLMQDHPYVGELKRPQPPWPKGVQH